MANTKDFIVKNAVEVGGPTKVTVGDAATGGSYTAGYDLSIAAYDSVSLSVSGQDTVPYAATFKDDGTKMYMLGNNTNNVYQYSLSTANDLSTASYDSVSFSVASQTTLPSGIFFKSDGTKMYIGELGSSNAVYQYSLSTAWDISTASYDSVSFSRTSQGNSNISIFFKPDGTKMYSASAGAVAILEYGLSTAWDVSTASYNGSLSVSTEDAGLYGLWFKNDGTEVFITGLTNDKVFRYDLSTAWDVTSGSYSGVSFSVSAQETSPVILTFSSDGTKMFSGGTVTDTIYQYSTGSTVTTGSFDLSTGNYFTDTPSADVEYTFSNAGDVQSFQLEVTGNSAGYDLSSAAYDSVSFSVSGQETGPIDATFKTDGTKMFLIGSTGDDVNEYDLSTAWDVSTASFVQSFSVSTQETFPTGIDFKSDGAKMYIIGNNDTVYQYSLSTAWDVSTASYDSVTLSVATEMGSPRGLSFKDDGTKLYTMNSVDDTVYQYGLSTAWDVSSGSYDSKSFSVSTQTVEALGFDLSHDGTSFVVVAGGADDAFYSYELSTAWDISTASYVTSLSATQDTSQQGVAFGNSGVKMYLIGNGSDTVYQYTTGSAITVTWDADIAWPSGTAPDSPAAGEKDIYTFTTDDGGITYIGVQSGDAFS